MVKEYFKNFMLSRFHIFLFTISSIVMRVELYQYIFLSGENNGVSFLFNSNMSFLVFTNILYVFLIYRYYTYQRLRKFSVIRINKSKYCKFILKIELLIWIHIFCGGIPIICLFNRYSSRAYALIFSAIIILRYLEFIVDFISGLLVL